MQADGIAPNVVTYSTLIAQSPAYEDARAWFERMQADGIAPDIVTSGTLLRSIPDLRRRTRLGLTACRPTALHRTSSPTDPYR